VEEKRIPLFEIIQPGEGSWNPLVHLLSVDLPKSLQASQAKLETNPLCTSFSAVVQHILNFLPSGTVTSFFNFRNAGTDLVGEEDIKGNVCCGTKDTKEVFQAQLERIVREVITLELYSVVLKVFESLASTEMVLETEASRLQIGVNGVSPLEILAVLSTVFLLSMPKEIVEAIPDPSNARKEMMKCRSNHRISVLLREEIEMLEARLRCLVDTFCVGCQVDENAKALLAGFCCGC
jgi:hypothetical protein